MTRRGLIEDDNTVRRARETRKYFFPFPNTSWRCERPPISGASRYSQIRAQSSRRSLLHPRVQDRTVPRPRACFDTGRSA